MTMFNIVLVTVDCLRYDRCGFNGHDRNTTPVLDALANESYVFDNAYATGPYTTESVPGIIAGQHSYNGAHFGEHLAWKAIPTESRTVASYLSDNGYSTAASLTNPHITRDRNFDNGFDTFRNLERGDGETDETDSDGQESSWGRSMMNAVLSKSRSRLRDQRMLVNPYVAAYVAYRYAQVQSGWPTIPAERVIREAVAEFEILTEPFFVWTHLMDLHAPIRPQTAQEGGLAGGGRTTTYLISDAARASQIHTPMYKSIYDSALRYVDSCLREIIDELRRHGQWDNTVLILSSDHGEALYDRNETYGHPRHYLYDELLHVPLLIRLPGLDGERIEQPVSLAWMHELIAEVLELPRGEFAARSGVETLLSNSDDDRNYVVSDTLDGGGHSISVRDDRHKLLSHRNGYETHDEEYEYFGQDVLIQYSTDVGERVPLSRSDRPELRAVANELHSDPESHPRIAGRFEPEVEERLRDLGYRI